MEISSSGDGDLGLGLPYMVPRDKWHLISDECSVEEARNCLSPEAGVGVIGVVRGGKFDDIIGLLEFEDLMEKMDGAE